MMIILAVLAKPCCEIAAADGEKPLQPARGDGRGRALAHRPCQDRACACRRPSGNRAPAGRSAALAAPGRWTSSSCATGKDRWRFVRARCLRSCRRARRDRRSADGTSSAPKMNTRGWRMERGLIASLADSASMMSLHWGPSAVIWPSVSMTERKQGRQGFAGFTRPETGKTAAFVDGDGFQRCAGFFRPFGKRQGCGQAAAGSVVAHQRSSQRFHSGGNAPGKIAGLLDCCLVDPAAPFRQMSFVPVRAGRPRREGSPVRKYRRCRCRRVVPSAPASLPLSS